MINIKEIYQNYETTIVELKRLKIQIDIAIQGLEAIIQSGQINIADKTLEAIKEVAELNDTSV